MSKRGSLRRGFAVDAARAVSGGGRGGEALQVGLDSGITVGQLVLIGVEQLQVLLQREEVLRAIVSGEGVGDLCFGGVAAMIAILGEVVGLTAPRLRCRAASGRSRRNRRH